MIGTRYFVEHVGQEGYVTQCNVVQGKFASFVMVAVKTQNGWTAFYKALSSQFHVTFPQQQVYEVVLRGEKMSPNDAEHCFPFPKEECGEYQV